jgi:hypothetical protein
MQKQTETPRTEDRPKQDPIDHGIIVAGPDAHENEGAERDQGKAPPDKSEPATPRKS